MSDIREAFEIVDRELRQNIPSGGSQVVRAWGRIKAALQSQTAPAVPVELRDRLMNLLCALGHQGCDMGDGQMYDVGEWGIKEAQDLHTLLAAAPQPDHSPDAGKVVEEMETESPITFSLYCPECSELNEQVAFPLKTHQCQSCGHEWHPFLSLIHI